MSNITQNCIHYEVCRKYLCNSQCPNYKTSSQLNEWTSISNGRDTFSAEDMNGKSDFERQ